MFYFSSDESEEEQPRSVNSSGSVGSRIDDFEDTLERKLKMKSGSCYVRRCFGDILKVLINGTFGLKIRITWIECEIKK